MFKIDREEIAASVDLEGGKGGEGEVCGSPGELDLYAVIERTRRRGERCLTVELERWDSRDGKREHNGDAVRVKEKKWVTDRVARKEDSHGNQPE